VYPVYFFDFGLVSSRNSDLIFLRMWLDLLQSESIIEDTFLLERAFLLILDRILLPLSGEKSTPRVAPVSKPNTIDLNPFLDMLKYINCLILF